MGRETIRIQGVPRDWDTDQLESFLREQGELKNPTVKSLAPEINGRWSTATINSEDDTSLQPGGTRRLPLPKLDNIARSEHVTLDVDFLGVTTLFCPPKEDHKINVVAISGLGGHAFGSFKEKGQDYMWLRDALPNDLTSATDNEPLARVMIYGYQSAIEGSMRTANIEDMALSFYNSLLSLAAEPQTRPIVFIAHSLGGLIVKQALIMLARSEGEEDIKFLKAVYGIVFFGVPHDGMDISTLIPMVGDGPNRFLIECLSHVNSQVLSMQQREFHGALGAKGAAEIFCFYETQLSPTALQDEKGKWAMTGPLAVLVTKSSATHCRHWEVGAEHICAIDQTHSGMVKFSPHGNDYDMVRGRMQRLVRRAATTLRRVRMPNVHFVVPYDENTSFVGRSEILSQLKQQLGFGWSPGNSRSQPRVSLHGLGGVGKTQVAITYVFWLRDACPEISVFWVHASSVERFRQSYFDIAQKCQIPGYNDPTVDVLPLVKKWLEEDDRDRWLMVIDNADDTELFFNQSDAAPSANGTHLSRYLPERGSLLITTRNKKAAIKLTKGRIPILVGPMEDADCETLLRTRLSGDAIPEAGLSLLSNRLEHIPLGLVQAAAFLQENTMTIPEYLKLQEESDQDMVTLLSHEFETDGRDPETSRALAQTWMVSFNQIEERNALAGQLLSFMCVLDRQAIPKDIIYHYSDKERTEGPSSKVQFAEALGTLKAFCLILEEKSGTFDMHRLVQLVTRKWLTSRGTIDRFRREALLTLSDLYPYGEYETRTTCAAYVSHANVVLRSGKFGARDEAEAKALLLHNIAAYWIFEGKWSDAENLITEAIDIRRELFGGNDDFTLSSMTNLASTIFNQGRWKEAEKLQVQVVGTYKTKLGVDYPKTLTSMANLAIIFCHQGQLEEAEKLQVQVVETRRKKLSVDHPDTLKSMARLAAIYWRQGRWEEAEKLQVQVIETSKTKLGVNHPDILRIMGNLALTYGDQGRCEEAEKLGVQVLETRKKKLGVNHPETLISMANLASTYGGQGRWEEAEKLEVQVLETSKKKLGADHPDTLHVMNNLAYTRWDLGKTSAAIDMMRTCIYYRRIKLGPDHPDTRDSIYALETWESEDYEDQSSC